MRVSYSLPGVLRLAVEEGPSEPPRGKRIPWLTSRRPNGTPIRRTVGLEGTHSQHERLRRVTGHHGTGAAEAARILQDGFKPSETGWLGPGVYFFEHNPDQAWNWARMHCGHAPRVLAAELRLGEDGLDLLRQSHRELFQSFSKLYLAGISTEDLNAIAEQDEGFMDATVFAALAAGEDAVPWVRAALLLGRKDYSSTGKRGRLDPPAKTITLGFGTGSRVLRNINIQVAVLDPDRIENVVCEPHPGSGIGE